MGGGVWCSSWFVRFGPGIWPCGGSWAERLTSAQYLSAIRELTTDTFTIRELAVAVAGEEAVTKYQTDQARYHAEALADAAVLIAEPKRKGVANRYRLAETANNTDNENSENDGLPYDD